MEKNPRVLVTGGSGFIGGNLSIALVKKGYSVRVFYRPGDDTRLLESTEIERFEGDICDGRRLLAAMDGCQGVFHTAGSVSFRRRDRHVQRRVNVQGTRVVVETCRLAGVKRLVHTSTVNTLGNPASDDDLGDENTPLDFGNCIFHYALTKKLGEDIALHANGDEFNVVVVNPGTVFGPGDVNVNAGSYITTVAKTPLMFYPEGGTNCVHVDYVVNGHIAAFEKGCPGERYILGGENLSYREMFTIIADVLNRPRPRFALPTGPSVVLASLIEHLADLVGSDLKLSAEAARAGGIKFFYSSEKARRELGLKAIPFRQAVEDAVAWYRQEGYLA